MVYYSKEFLVPIKQGIMCLTHEDENEEAIGYFYVSKNVYDAAVVLESVFSSDIDMLIEKNFTIVDSHINSVYWFYENVPSPINMLAPYLYLCSEKIDLGNDIELLTGALHQISQSMDFYQFTIVPKEVKSTVLYTKSMVMKYKDSWVDVTDSINSLHQVGIMQNQQQQVIYQPTSTPVIAPTTKATPAIAEISVSDSQAEVQGDYERPKPKLDANGKHIIELQMDTAAYDDIIKYSGIELEIKKGEMLCEAFDKHMDKMMSGGLTEDTVESPTPKVEEKPKDSEYVKSEADEIKSIIGEFSN